jgi:hypothetical protein
VTAPGIKLNRAPVLTLRAAVVAERLGHPPDLALTLGHAVAGSSARAKARSIGIAEDRDHTAEKREHELRPALKPVRLLGHEIRLAATEAGELLAEDKGKAGVVRRYLIRGFGQIPARKGLMPLMCGSSPPLTTPADWPFRRQGSNARGGERKSWLHCVSIQCARRSSGSAM